MLYAISSMIAVIVILEQLRMFENKRDLLIRIVDPFSHWLSTKTVVVQTFLWEFK